MNLKQAQYIRTIVQEGSITAAARKLYISQPALSQTVRQAETELGVKLLVRGEGSLRLTYAGEKYLQAADKIQVARQQLENQLQEIRRENSGRLRLGISVQRGMQILPLALPEFIEKYPHVDIELTEAGSARLEEMVWQGRVDLALAAIDSTSPNLVYRLIEKEVIGILAGRDSALCRNLPSGTPVTLEDVQDERFVSLKSGHSVRVVQDKLFHSSRKTPFILLETDSLAVAKRVALETGSCMFCSDIFADETVYRQGGFYPLRDYENNRHFYACYRKGETLPRFAEDFIGMITAVLEQGKPAEKNLQAVKENQD